MPKTALVTGGNRGIGLAIVQGLAAKGYRVLLGSRDLNAGEKAAAQITGDVKAVQLDLSENTVLRTQVKAMLADGEDIDVLVNNAAILLQGNLLEVPETDFYDSVQTNFLAVFELTRLLVPDMVTRNYGRVVNVSSGWGSFGEGLSGPAAYSITKAALNAITKSISQSLPDTVKVNSLCPGWVRTRMGGASADRSPEEGAETAIWLATLPENGPTGGFFRDKQSIEW